MSNVISISAAKREALGSAASRRLRKQGQVPAIVCAKGEDNVNIQIPVAVPFAAGIPDQRFSVTTYIKK